VSQNLNIRWLIILGAILISCYFIKPTYDFYSIKNDPDLSDIDIDYLKEDALKLGLDLQGGLYIILELDYATYLLNQANTKLTANQKNNLSQLIIESLNVKNNNDILDHFLNTSIKRNINLKEYYSQLMRHEIANNNNDIILILKEKRLESMNNILEIMRNRVESHNQYGVGEPSIQKLGDDRLVIELAGVTDVANAREYVQRTAEFKLTLVEDIDLFKELIFKIDDYVNSPSIQLQTTLIPLPSGMLALEKDYQAINDIIFKSEPILSNKYNLLWDNKSFMGQDGNIFRQLYLVSSKPAISGGQVKDPKAIISGVGNEDAGSWVVNLDMTTEGKIKWGRFTGNNIGERVAIVLDNKVFMAPSIQSKISSGGTRITGFANKQEAEDIASVLKAGELPAPINVVQINYIGPSLGNDSITSGSYAMILGLMVIFLFMIIYYKLSGLIASLALSLNIILVCAILVTMDAILTLPGIAGLLLTVGMAVDANIIIFERIREEIKIGNNARSSIINGYNRAFITILDANVTTLITAFVLSFIGSGPIKGFATTLSVGILCSMFTAIFFTKTIFLSLTNFFKNKKLSI
tara:strand:- start:1089 stop:2831 length:1743 start_codon:yes stop_codon:yes gene_type:complete